MILFRVASIESVFFFLKEWYIFGLKHLMKWFAMRVKAHRRIFSLILPLSLSFCVYYLYPQRVQCSCYLKCTRERTQQKQIMNLNCTFFFFYLEWFFFFYHLFSIDSSTRHNITKGGCVSVNWADKYNCIPIQISKDRKRKERKEN